MAAVVLAQSKTISILSRGEPISSLLEEGSRQSGIQMEALPQTSGEIVLVSVKSITPEAFREKLALAIGASWKSDKGVFRLGRSLGLERAQEAAERHIRVQEVSRAIQNLAKKVSQQPQFDAKAAQNLATRVAALSAKYKGHLSDSPGLEASIALEPESPGGRLAISAIASLSPEQIADVPPGGRIVYSSNPTQVQRTLPPAVYPAIQRYVAEQQTYAQALNRAVPSSSWSNSWSSLLSTNSPEAPETVLVTTQRSPYNPSLTVHFMLANKDGVITSQPQVLLDIPGLTTSESDIAEGLIDPSPSSKRLLDGIKALQSGKTYLEDQTIVHDLSNPETHDPLSFLIADGMLASAKDQNLIACIPDDGFFNTLFGITTPENKIDLKKFSHWLLGSCSVIHSKNWIVVTPRRQVTTRVGRVDRKLAGAFFRHSQDNDGASLEEMAEFVGHMPRNYMDTILPFLAFFVLPELNSGINDRNVELLRVYGRLDPSQRAALQEQRTITVSSLTAASHEDLNYLAFRADSPIRVTVTQRRGAPPNAGGYKPSLSTEITNALPGGVPESARLVLEGRSEDAVIVDGGTSPSSNYQPLSAWSLGSTLARGEIADPTDKREAVRMEKYRFGRTRHLSFHLELTDSVSVGTEFNESKFSRRKPSVTFSELPQSFREAVEAAKIQARKQFQNTSGPKKTPPPLP